MRWRKAATTTSSPLSRITSTTFQIWLRMSASRTPTWRSSASDRSTYSLAVGEVLNKHAPEWMEGSNGSSNTKRSRGA